MANAGEVPEHPMDSPTKPQSSDTRLMMAADHPITDAGYIARCREQLDRNGALVLKGFFPAPIIKRIVDQSAAEEENAFYADSTHNVYLTDPDPSLPPDHPFNRQVVSSKGLIADDQLPPDSPLRAIYGDERFRRFLCGVLGIPDIHPYADRLSSINVHFAAAGMELGWHFDNSSFAVTMLLQAPEGGGHFEYVPGARDARRRRPGVRPRRHDSRWCGTTRSAPVRPR